MGLIRYLESENESEELLERYKQLKKDIEKVRALIRSHQIKADDMADELTDLRIRLQKMGVKI